MGRTNGQMRTCDRCGATVFLKCTGEGDRDGGYTRWNCFEDPPKGWNILTSIGDICPECWAEYSAMFEEFKTKLSKNGFEGVKE